MEVKSQIDTFKVQDDDVVVTYIDSDKVRNERIRSFIDDIKNTFPNNKLLFLPVGMSIGVLDKAKSIDILEQILEKLKENDMK